MLIDRQKRLERQCFTSYIFTNKYIQVREESGNVFMIYGSKESKTRWNTYRACMRRDGVWGPVDLNHRLTANIFAGVMARYDREKYYGIKQNSYM
jgi:hypothetical protein